MPKVGDMIGKGWLDKSKEGAVESYPIYKQYTSGQCNLYVAFEDLDNATILKIDGDATPAFADWKVGYKLIETVKHTQPVWKHWHGPRETRKFKMKDYK